MKNLFKTIYEVMIDWASVIAEYRKNNASRHYY